MQRKKRLSEDHKRKIGDSFRGRKLSPERREKIRLGNLGKKRSAETRARISAAKKGHPPWNKGLKGVQTPWNKGRPWPVETRRRMSFSKVLGSLNTKLKPKYQPKQPGDEEPLKIVNLAMTAKISLKHRLDVETFLERSVFAWNYERYKSTIKLIGCMYSRGNVFNDRRKLKVHLWTTGSVFLQGVRSIKQGKQVFNELLRELQTMGLTFHKEQTRIECEQLIPPAARAIH